MANEKTYFLITSVLLITFGASLIFLRTVIFDLMVSSIFTLGPNSPILNFWRNPPITVTTNFYIFNWTNPEEIHNLSSKPIFRETGPYSFDETVEKVNLTWNSNNTVTFKMLRTWQFDENRSVGKLTDLITTINAITATAAYKMKDWSYFLQTAFSFSLGVLAPEVQVVKSADELLFKGYQDPYIDFAKNLPYASETLLTFNKFGWMFARNNSYDLDGVFNMATDLTNFGEFLNWNYANQTPHYEGTCGKVNGALPQLYPQRQSRDSIGMFVPYACRNIKLDYETDVTVKNIHGYKFSAQHSMLDNGTLLPENKCYCNGECMSSGVLNVSSCARGMPTFLSLPHFYGADPVFLHQLEGLRPNKSKHEMFVVLEPRTGSVMEIALRLQLNLILHPAEYITLFQDVPKMLFPVLWFEQKVTIGDDLAWMIWLLLSVPSLILPLFGAILISVGVCLLVLIYYQLINKLYKKANGFEQVPVQITSEKVRTDFLAK